MTQFKESAIWPYLVLTRPANLITAVADVAAGFAIGYILSGEHEIWVGVQAHLGEFLLLCLATIGLYGGGVVFNDVFDFELDKVERPERPLPAGKLSKGQATALGGALFLLGIFAAFQIGLVSALISIGIALCALLYDAKAKHHVFFGPLNMSLCRGGNLMLGVSVFSAALSSAYLLMIFPVIYIGSITLISQGEVSGGNKSHLIFALIGYIIVVGLLLSLGLVYPFELLQALPFIALFGIMVFPPLLKALKSLGASDIRSAVKAGVISLIILNASFAAGFAGILYGIGVLALLPISMALGKYFSVT